MRFLDPRPWSATSLFGWQVHIDTEGLCTYRDESGRLQASYRVLPWVYPNPRLGLMEHPISLPEGEVVLFNGKRGAVRRSSHNGHLVMRGRRYEFRHKRRRRCELWCDGLLIATLRRRWRTTVLVGAAPRDDTDLLAAVLCEYAVRPGRPGVMSAIMDALFA
ncbi:hypothetical protein [Kribbella deserti]|uniref:Uncharacterized protein n=1 Tax=Kribbella deserti TaxID=1926257 RepID=A0ABV6QJ14_9ACTN